MLSFFGSSLQSAAAQETSIAMDLQHQHRLSEANANLETLLSHGNSVMDSLKNQRFTLKVRFKGGSGSGCCGCSGQLL